MAEDDTIVDAHEPVVLHVDLGSREFQVECACGWRGSDAEDANQAWRAYDAHLEETWESWRLIGVPVPRGSATIVD